MRRAVRCGRSWMGVTPTSRRAPLNRAMELAAARSLPIQPEPPRAFRFGLLMPAARRFVLVTVVTIKRPVFAKGVRAAITPPAPDSRIRLLKAPRVRRGAGFSLPATGMKAAR